MNKPSLMRQLITSFAAVYPAITLIGWFLMPILGTLSWPGRTLVLTLVMVPFVAFVTGPAAHRIVVRLLPNTASAVPSPQPLERAR